MYAILAIAACCAIVPATMAAVALVKSLGRRRGDPGKDTAVPNKEIT